MDSVRVLFCSRQRRNLGVQRFTIALEVNLIVKTVSGEDARGSSLICLSWERYRHLTAICLATCVLQAVQPTSLSPQSWLEMVGVVGWN